MCKDCRIEKESSEFYPHPTTSDRLFSMCKSCNKIRVKKYIENTPGARDKRKARSKAFREANPEHSRRIIKKAYYLQNYGITYDEFLDMYDASGKKCAICEREVVHKGKNNHNRAVVDHCHRTGKIRGILCHMCNASIGLMRENKELIMKVYKYLEKHDG